MNGTDEAIYPERKVITGVLVGGPLAGAYYFWRTLRSLGKPMQAGFIAAGAILLLVVLITITFIPAFDRVPNVVFWGVQLGLVYGIYRGYLAAPVAAHIEAGKRVFGWTNTLVVAVISLIITMGPMSAVLYLTGAFEGPSVHYYGNLRHEIEFDEKNITSAEIDKIGVSLQSAGFFDEELQKTVDVSRQDDRYIITMYCSEGARNPEFMNLVNKLRSDVQKSFPSNPIVIDLVIGTPDNRIARIE